MIVGLTVIATAVVVLGAIALIYINPPGKKVMAFETTDAASIHSGEDVRVAGIVVGKVTDVSMQAQSVRVETKIDREVFVGDQARIDVRMLTPVGGYAITLIPGGTTESSATIPVARVNVPYSIGDVIQAVPKTTDEVDPGTWNENIAQVADALAGNDTSLRTIVDGLESVTGVFARQRDQVHQIAELSAQYLNTFNANREFVFTLIKKIDAVVTAYHVNSAGFNYAYYLFANVLYKANPSFRTYLVNSEAYEPQIEAVMASIRSMEKELIPTIDGLVAMRGKLSAALPAGSLQEMSNGHLMLSDLCIPVAGKKC